MMKSVQDRNFYKLLELPPTTNVAEIKSAYKKAALKHHPDKGGSDKMFVAISNAYQLLLDEDFRNNYFTVITSESKSEVDFINVFLNQTSEKFSDAQPWVRKGDFKPEEKAVYNNREVSYKHAKKGDYRSLTLFGFRDGRISVTYYFPSDALFDECMNKRTGFTNFSTDDNRKSKLSVGIFQTKSKAKLLELIMIIDQHDPLNEIKKEIFAHLDLPLPLPALDMKLSLILFNEPDKLEPAADEKKKPAIALIM